MKTCTRLGLTASLALVLATPSAFAAGKLAVSAERLFGFLHARSTTDGDAGTTASSSSSFALGSPITGGTYSVPRIGVDYIMPNGLTLGGALAFGVLGSETAFEANDGDEVTDDGPSATRIGIVPRVGYLAWLSGQLGIWPRGGFSYFNTNSTNEEQNLGGDVVTTERSDSDLALTLEVPLVLSASPNVWFLFAPTLDYGLNHSTTVTVDDDELDNDNAPDVTNTDFGLQFAIVGVF